MQSSRRVRLGASGGHDGDPVAGERRTRAACWMQTGQVPVRMKYAATARAWPRRSARVTRLPAASRTLRSRGNRCSVWTGMTTSKCSTQLPSLNT